MPRFFNVATSAECDHRDALMRANRWSEMWAFEEKVVERAKAAEEAARAAAVEAAAKESLKAGRARDRARIAQLQAANDQLAAALQEKRGAKQD